MAVLGDFYQAHAEMVYYVCMRYVKDSERSKDAVMQIFEELIHKVNKQEIQRFGSWLYVLSRNHCLLQLRAEKNRHHVSIADFVEFPLPVHPADEDRKSIRMNFRHSCASRMPSFD